MKNEFNVGDRVKGIARWHGKDIDGKAGTIIGFSADIAAVEFDENIGGHNCGGVVDGLKGKVGHCWWCIKDKLERISPDKLIFKGNETILIKDGKEYVSKCADGDFFDKEKGLLLCLAKANGVSYEDLQKMIDGAEDKNKEAAEKAIKNLAERAKIFIEAGFKALKGLDNANTKPEAENAVKEVKRRAKVGEYIKIVNAGVTAATYGNGDILKVYKRTYGAHCETAKKLSESDCKKYDHDNGNIVILDEEYVVLENYKPYKITLSEFWESKDELAIHCKDEKDKSKLFEVMREKGFYVEGKLKGDGLYNYVTNEKKLFCVDINTKNFDACGCGKFAIYEFNEVDLNN